MNMHVADNTTVLENLSVTQVQTYITSGPIVINHKNATSHYHLSGVMYYQVQEDQMVMIGAFVEGQHTSGPDLGAITFENVGQTSGLIEEGRFQIQANLAYTDQDNHRVPMEATLTGQTQGGIIIDADCQTIGDNIQASRHEVGRWW